MSNAWMFKIRRNRYRLMRLLYRLRRATGGPDYLDEIDYWQQILTERSPLLHDHKLRGEAFSRELREALADVQRRGNSRPRLLEVGSGPVSIIAAGVDERLVDVTAVDPLARVYRDLLSLNGLDYPVRPRPGRGEYLRRLFGPRAFDVVYSSNALDHTTSPRRCLEQMCEVLKTGGYLVLEGFINEGSNGKWIGLHQHDLSPSDGQLIDVDRHGTRSVLTAGLPLACVTERVCEFKDRGIHAFGYEFPPDMDLEAPDSWAHRRWYTLSFQRVNA